MMVGYVNLDPDWLREQHHENKLDLGQIAKLAGVSRYVVRYALKKYGIPAVRHRPRIKWDYDWLRQKYVVEGLSLAEMGQMIGKSPESVRHALKRAGIEPRSRVTKRVRAGRDTCNRCEHFEDCLDWEDDEPCLFQ